MKTNAISDHELVKACVRALCEESGIADPGIMVQRDFLFLSGRIESRTGVSISLSTLKRLLNGQFARMPQIATLDALARSLDYPNWQAFRAAKNQERSNMPPTTIAGAHSKRWRGRWMLWALPVFAALLGIYGSLRTHKHGVTHAGKASFSATKVTGNDIPNTVIFSYNVDSIDADSFFIQQSWDRNRRVRIDKDSHTFTDIYYEPGYHIAKLIAGDEIIRTVDVSIPTDRWFYYSKEHIPKSLPVYISPKKPFQDGFLQMTPDDLLNSKVDGQKKNDYLMVYFPSRIEASADNFVLYFRARVDPIGTDPCPFLESEVFCQHYFLFFKSTSRGCASESAAEFGEKYLNGKTYDLSALGADIRTWQDIRLEISNRNVSLSMNGHPVFSTSYRQSCGLITGLGFISNGLCKVDSVDLRSTDGKTIYQNGFTQ